MEIKYPINNKEIPYVKFVRYPVTEKKPDQIIDKLNHVDIRINEEITHDKFARDPIKGRQTGKQKQQR